MPLIYFVTYDGNQYEAEVETGKTVMEAAVENMIDGILAECGGSCSCATCHCYIDEQWLAVTGEAKDTEKEMLEIPPEPKDNSRLSCQITITDQMDGLIVHLPKSQY